MASSENGWSTLFHLTTLKAQTVVCNTSISRSRDGDYFREADFSGAILQQIFSRQQFVCAQMDAVVLSVSATSASIWINL
jgi:hypothetical protein